jgi:hypothetical protein
VDKELAGGFGDVQVILKEALNRHQSLAVKRFQGAVFEYFLKEHLAQSSRQLIDQTADTQILVADNILFGIEHLAYFQRDLCFFVGTGEILDIINRLADTDGNTGEELRIQRISNGLGEFLNFLNGRIGFNFLDEHDILLTDTDHIILILIRENVTCGLVDFWSGAGSVLEIQPEKKIKLPLKYIHSVKPDGIHRYAIKEIYGVTSELWENNAILETKLK